MWSPETHSDTERFESLNQETVLGDFIALSKADRAVRFYDATLAVLGLKRCDTSGEANWEGWAGWGTYEEHGAREIALWVCTPICGDLTT